MSEAKVGTSIEDAIKNSDWSSVSIALWPHIVEQMKLHSKNIFECEMVYDLAHINTVPALYDDNNGTRKQVIVPMKVFTRDIDAELEKAKEVTTAAQKATDKANTAANNADKAREDLETKKQEVDNAVAESKTATEAAKKATSDTLASKMVIEQNEETRKTAEQTRAASEASRVKAEQARVDVESKRVSAESARASAEQERASSETARASSETSRVNVENQRQTAERARSDAEADRALAEAGRGNAEAGRVSAEKLRETNTSTAIASSVVQTSLAKELNEHPTIAGENGNWWRWNLQTHAYEDTGIIARGGAMYPTFRQSRNKLLMIDYGSNVSEHVVKRRNKLVIKV
nr:MAG TPA: hypothetical protein [Caudoviricetes sp.]